MSAADVEPGRFFYITVTSENAGVSGTMTPVFASYSYATDMFSRIKTRAESLMDDCVALPCSDDITPADDTLEALFCMDIAKSATESRISRIVLWKVDRRGHQLH